MTLDNIRQTIARSHHEEIFPSPLALEDFCMLVVDQYAGHHDAIEERTWAYEELISLRLGEGRSARAMRLYRQYLADCAAQASPEFDALYLAGLQATQMPPTPLRRRDRFWSLTQLFQKTQHLDGLMAECGCFRGLSSYILCSMLRQAHLAQGGFSGKGYRIFDSFAGLSNPQAEDAVTGSDPEAERVRQMTRPGKYAASIDTVKRALAEFPDIAYFPGWIPQAFPDETQTRYRFVHVDVDIYQPTRDSFEYFYARLVPGGIIVSDDFNWPGARKAIEEFCERNRLTLNTTPYTQAYLVKS